VTKLVDEELEIPEDLAKRLVYVMVAFLKPFGATENLTRCARIELTPLETVWSTTDTAEGPSSSAPAGALARRVVCEGKIIHAEGVPR